MQMASIFISILVSATEIATAGKVTPASMAVLSGVPLCALLGWLLHKQKDITHSFLAIFDIWVVASALIFDALACYALSQSKSDMFTVCVAYLTVAYVLPQVSQRQYARVFTVAHVGMVFCLFKFNAEKFVPFVINCVLLDVGNDRLARSLGCVAQRQAEGNKELFKKSRGFIKSMISGFCDALVVMGPDWTLDEDSPSLAALLGRPAPKGKEFHSFIDDGDREDFRNFMESPITNTGDSDKDIPKIDSVRLQTVRLHVFDAYNNAVAVHVCCASLQSIDKPMHHLVGISEMSPITSAKKSRAHKGHHRPPSVYNLTTGKIEPASHAWTPKQVQVEYSASSREVLSQSTGSARKRRDSPLPRIGTPGRSHSDVGL